MKSLLKLGSLSLAFIALPAAGQEGAAPATPTQAGPRLDLYGDPLPEGAIARMGSIRFRSTDSILDIVFSPDGSAILGSGGGDRVISTWDAATGRSGESFIPISDTWPYRSRRSLRIEYSPDGRWMAMAAPGSAFDGVIGLIWDPVRHRLHAELKVVRSTAPGQRPGAAAIAYSPNGRIIATSGGRGTIRLWDANTGDELASRDMARLINGATALPEGATLPTAGQVLGSRGLVFVDSGRSIAGTATNGRFFVWDTTDQRPTRFVMAHEREIGAIAASPDGTRIYTGGRFSSERRFSPSAGEERTIYKSGVRVWDAATLERVAEFRPEEIEGDIAAMALSPDGRLLAVIYHSRSHGPSDQSVSVWDVESGEEIKRFESRLPLSGFRGSLAWSPDGRRLVAGGPGSLIRLWDFETGEPLDPHVATHHKTLQFGLFFSPDGRIIASFGFDNSLRLWEAETGRHLRRLITGDSPSTGVAFSPDGRWIAAGGEARTARVWEVATGREVFRAAFEIETSQFAFSPDSQTLAIGLDSPTMMGVTRRDVEVGDYVQLWDFQAGVRSETALLGATKGETHFVSFTPDGSRVVAMIGAEVKVWDAATGTMRFKFDLPRMGGLGGAVGLTPGGDRLATLGAEYKSIQVGRTSGQAPAGPNQFTLWNLMTGEPERAVEVPPLTAREFRFAGGEDLIFASTLLARMGAARLIDTRTGETRAALRPDRPVRIVAVAVSPDGRLGATGHRDGTILVWDLTRWR